MKRITVGLFSIAMLSCGTLAPAQTAYVYDAYGAPAGMVQTYNGTTVVKDSYGFATQYQTEYRTPYQDIQQTQQQQQKPYTGYESTYDYQYQSAQRRGYGNGR